MSQAGGGVPLAPDQVEAILQGAVAKAVSRGARVESVVGPRAVVVWGKPVNNVLRLILTGERREEISVDAYGQIEYRRIWKGERE
jgi:hypothetical protein